MVHLSMENYSFTCGNDLFIYGKYSIYLWKIIHLIWKMNYSPLENDPFISGEMIHLPLEK